jgi:hypothetical protein
VAAGAAADVDHSHVFRDHLLKKVELGTQEGPDLVRLRGRIESPIQ